MKRKISIILSLAMVVTSVGFSSLAIKAESSVPKIEITSKNGDGNSINKESGKIELTNVKLNGSDLKFDTKEPDTLEVKGFGASKKETKKQSYKIKFGKKQIFDGIEGRDEGKGYKSWRLYGSIEDPSLMRNKLAYDFARKIELQYQTETIIVDLFIDGKNKGSYVLAGDVQPKEGRVDIKADMEDDYGSGDINLFTGNCILEYAKGGTDEPPEDYHVTSPTTAYKFCLHDPAPEDVVVEPVEETVQKFLAKVKEELTGVDNALSSNVYANVTSKIDVDSFVKSYIVHELFKPKNIKDASVYYYFKDGKLYAGPVQDFDESANNGINPEKNPEYYTNADGSDRGVTGYWAKDRLPFVKELFKYPEFEKAVAEKYQSLKSEITNLYAEKTGVIDTLESTYGSSFSSNFAAVEDNGAGWEGDHAKAVTELKTWLKDRSAWLDANLLVKNTIYTRKPVLIANAAPSGNKAIKVTWNNVPGATGYVVYGSTNCKKFKKIAATKKTSLKVSKIGKKLKAKKIYGIQVIALGANVSSRKIAVITGKKGISGKYGNVKKVAVVPALTLKVGAYGKINGKVTTVKKNKKSLPNKYGAQFTYVSDTPEVAIVNSNGIVLAKYPGSARIYTQGINGKYAMTVVNVIQ